MTDQPFGTESEPEPAPAEHAEPAPAEHAEPAPAEHAEPAELPPAHEDPGWLQDAVAAAPSIGEALRRLFHRK